MVWTNGAFRVFANPRRIGWQSAKAGVIPDAALYAEAAGDALSQGRIGLANYAQAAGAAKN